MNERPLSEAAIAALNDRDGRKTNIQLKGRDVALILQEPVARPTVRLFPAYELAQKLVVPSAAVLAV